MLLTFLILLVGALQVQADIQPQLQPPYTCTTTTSCLPGERRPQSGLQGDRSSLFSIPGKQGPKGEKGEPCQQNAHGAQNSVLPLMHSTRSHPAKGTKGERGERGEKGERGPICQCNETYYQELKTKIDVLQTKLMDMENSVRPSPGSTTTTPIIRAAAFANLPTMCSEVRHTGGNLERVALYPLKKYFDITPFVVNCTDGGWIVIQRRTTGSQTFHQNYLAYRKGFGNPDGEFWIGLETLHRLTSHAPYKLRIETVRKSSASKIYYEEHGHFYVEDEGASYRVIVGEYSGNTGNYMRHSNDMRFSASDHDVDTYSGSCAQSYYGGWWYKNCGSYGLNGKYGSYFTWGAALASSKMMIQPRC